MREVRHCYSVIREDLKLVSRHCVSSGSSDYIKIIFCKPNLVQGLLALEARTTPPAGSSIQFKSSPLAPENTNNTTSSSPLEAVD